MDVFTLHRTTLQQTILKNLPIIALQKQIHRCVWVSKYSFDSVVSLECPWIAFCSELSSYFNFLTTPKTSFYHLIWRLFLNILNKQINKQKASAKGNDDVQNRMSIFVKATQHLGLGSRDAPSALSFPSCFCAYTERQKYKPKHAYTKHMDSDLGWYPQLYLLK